MCMQNNQTNSGSVEENESSLENRQLSIDQNRVIHFGPIQVRRRSKPAPTLATGRRSKYEILDPDEEQKRQRRRTRNREAADRVRLHRLSIEQTLSNQIEALEKKEKELETQIQLLDQRKINLAAEMETHRCICPIPYEFFANSPHTQQNEYLDHSIVQNNLSSFIDAPVPVDDSDDLDMLLSNY